MKTDKEIIEFMNNEDEIRKMHEDTERHKAIECIKALSRIEGVTMSMSGFANRQVFIENIDLIMKYFEELLKELDR